MLKFKFTVLAALCLSTSISFAQAPEVETGPVPNPFALQTVTPGGKKVATCMTTEKMDGMDVQLDIYLQGGMSPGEGKGVYVQTIVGIGTLPSGAMKFTSSEQGKTFELSVLDAPSELFVKFTLPENSNPAIVDLYAANMGGRLWGSFSCQSDF